jgi:PHD/YefM family antitoxin component YafN of YafNO toxin-antitoxin module
MSVQTIKIGKQEFVLIPKRRYNQLTRAEQDQKDAEIARKGRAEILAGKVKTIPLEQARKNWGV